MSLQKKYNDRATSFRDEAISLKAKYNRFSFIRLAYFLVSIAIAVLIWQTIGVLPVFVFIIVFLVSFAKFVKWHHNVQYIQHQKEYLATINQNESKTLDGNYLMFGNGEEFVDANHPYGVDLDIFGEHSFFQYCNRTSSAIGKQCLADYLINTASRKEILLRQEAITELKDKLEWRQNLQAHGMGTEDSPIHLAALKEWLSDEGFVLKQKWVIAALVLIPIVVVAGLILSMFMSSGLMAILTLAIPALILKKFLTDINKTHVQTTHAGKILAYYAKLIGHIEQENFSSPKLQNLANAFKNGEDTASSSISKLSYIISQLNVRYNAFVIVLELLCLWDLQWIYRLEKWKAKHKNDLPSWFHSLQEFETLASLGTVYYNNPEWIFPVVYDEALVTAEELGHPLLLASKRICNDIDIPTRGHIKLITGSNMAGKSTFLRTVGLNIVMAMSGMPVCAKKLELPLLQVYTSMRTQDALYESTSSFYAELKRLKFIIEGVEEMENAPKGAKQVFFILDEILKGTNSNDRHTGSKALIKQLIKSKGSGLIATHDLELGALEVASDGAIENLCIEVEVRDGKLFFDYKIKRGVSQSFNATHLMRDMGIKLEVE